MHDQIVTPVLGEAAPASPPERTRPRSWRPAPPLAVLTALLLGVGLGMVDPLRGATGMLTPVGTLWINAVRMTVIPLVVSLLIVSIAAAPAPRFVGRLGVQAGVLFLGMLAVVAAITALVSPWVFAGLPLDPAATAALRANARIDTAAAASVSFRGWLLSLVPVNLVRALSEGALLPIVLFTVLFAVALTRLDRGPREAVTGFLGGVSQAMLVMVRWILALAPVGVFALAFPLGGQLGGAVVGAVGYFLLAGVALLVVTGAGLYLFAAVAGRVPLRRFARAVFPAQAVAFTSRSSLASLPLMLKAARDELRLPDQVAGFVLPLAVSVFKLTSPMFWVLGALFIARLYGIDLTGLQIVTVGAASIALQASTPGIPSGGLLIQAPLFASIGLPVEGLGILIAIDAIPDMFKTAFIVTADMAAAAVLARGATRSETRRD